VEVDEKVLIFDWFAGDRIKGYTFCGVIPEYEPDTPVYVFALLHGKKLPLVFPHKMQHLHPLTAVSRSSHHPPDIFRLPKHK